jgi:hypothetical protein
MVKVIACLIFSALLIACGTIEDTAWTNGVSPADAKAIRNLIHTAHPDCKIYSYDPHNGNAEMIVHTSCKAFLVRRSYHGWKIIEGAEIVIVT